MFFFFKISLLGFHEKPLFCSRILRYRELSNSALMNNFRARLIWKITLARLKWGEEINTSYLGKDFSTF